MKTSNKNFRRALWRTVFLLAVIFCAANFTFAQAPAETKFPKTIRGYKVYKAKVLIQTGKDSFPENAKKNFDSSVKVGPPQNFQVSFSGATFELPLSMKIYKTGGQVDSIAFEDMEVNGIKVQVEEFKEPFKFDKGIDTELPKPLKVKIHLAQSPGALLSFNPLSNEVEVTGKVYVFGTFKKFGMKFKRVVPTNVKLKTKLSLPLTGSN